MANLNVALLRDNWTATLFVNNLTDEDEAVDIIHDDQEQLSGLYVKPITYGLRLKYSFM